MDIISIVVIVLGLCLFETISSIDNAIINAQVLSTMQEKARKWFLLWGILIAGMTFVVVLGCLMDRMGVERELQKVPTFRRVYGEQRLAPRQVPGAQQPAVRGFQKMRLR